jgi:hypothetical protein
MTCHKSWKGQNFIFGKSWVAVRYPICLNITMVSIMHALLLLCNLLNLYHDFLSCLYLYLIISGESTFYTVQLTTRLKSLSVEFIIF